MRWSLVFAIFPLFLLAPQPTSADIYPCNEQGVLSAIEIGGGPHSFDCAGPTTVVTTRTLFIEADVILDGEGDLTLSGGNHHPVLWIGANVTAELHNLDITNGVATRNYPCCDGGGIRNRGILTLVNCRVFENAALYGGGGGIYNSGYVPDAREVSLTIIDGTISRNSARAGGGISNTAGATLTILGSTISENETIPDAPGSPRGGGIFSNSTLLITNTTISSNLAHAGGGGITQAAGDLRIKNSTFSGNWPDELSAGVVSVSNTILDGACSVVLVTSLGGNVESPGDTCGLTDPTDQPGVPDLLLGGLADNGGATDTHALLPGSVAIDAGIACPPPATDQRGVERPQGVSCDAGAYEAEPRKITVDVDVKPGSDVNPINPMSKGVIPVAVLGSDSFDVANVDSTTLVFGPDRAVPSHPVGGHFQDVNDDGFTDLLSHYRTQETGIAFGVTEACVTGDTYDGTPFEGCDSINTQPNCGHGLETALVLSPLVWVGGRRRRRR